MSDTMITGISMSLSMDVCQKLTQYHLHLDPTVIIGRNLVYNAPVHILSKTTCIASKIDAYTYIGVGSSIVTTKIGRYCSFGQYVQTGLGCHNISNVTTSAAWYKSYFPDFNNFSGPINRPVPRNSDELTAVIDIGHDVWVGNNALFPKDVTVGHGAVIGAGCIVTKDVPPYAVVVNGPRGSQVIKTRFSDEVIADLLDIQWWNYDIPKMISQGVEVPDDNIYVFIEFMRNIDPSLLIPLEKQWRYLMTGTTPHEVRLTSVDENFENPIKCN